MKKLFVMAEDANITVQGYHDEVAIEDVEFLKEDFKSEI